MVRLNRGGRGRGVLRPPVMPRHRPMRHPEPIMPGMPPFPRPMMRGAPRGRHMRPGLPHHLGPPPPPMGIPPLPPRPFLPLPPHHHLHSGRPMPHPPHPRHLLGPGLPPPPHLPFPRPPLRGKIRGGRGLKRLGTANGRAKKGQKRKERTEGDFFCETCDRGFKTQEKLDDHISEHEVCGRDGCTFTGHPKIIAKHVQAQHDSGLYNRIVFTANPEDIAKWIAERKSRFPTKANVEKKVAQRNEMFERGERILSDNKPFGNNTTNWKERQQTRSNYNNNKHFENEKRKQKERVKEKPKPLIVEDPDARRGNLPRFLGTAAFKTADEPTDDGDQNEAKISDDEDWIDSKNAANVEKPVVSNILASLVANYGSDSTDDDDDENSTLLHTKDKAKDPVVAKIVKNQTEGFTSVGFKAELEEEADSGPEECTIDREDKSAVPLVNLEKVSRVSSCKKSMQETQKTNQQIPNQYPTRPYPMRKRGPTLLEKLLQSEIRHERNVILQCVHYVVKNNFLGLQP